MDFSENISEKERLYLFGAKKKVGKKNGKDNNNFDNTYGLQSTNEDCDRFRQICVGNKTIIARIRRPTKKNK